MTKRDKNHVSISTPEDASSGGQSTVEYVMIVGLILGIFFIFLGGPNSIFQSRTFATFTMTSNEMETHAIRLFNSQQFISNGVSTRLNL